MSLKPSLLAVLTITTVAATVAWERSSHAQASAFVCTQDQRGVPTTFAQTANGESVPIFRWVSGYFNQAGYTPMRRCQEVTERMMIFKSQGNLSKLTSGRVNNQPVICAGTSCDRNGNNILFTLTPKQNANQVLQEIASNRQGGNGPSAQLSGGGETDDDNTTTAARPTNVIQRNQDGSVTFDLDLYLDTSTETSTEENANSTQNSPLGLPSSESTNNSPNFPQTTPTNSGTPFGSPASEGTNSGTPFSPPSSEGTTW